MRILNQLLGLLALAATLVGPTSLSAEVRLLMVEEDGCIYCQRWHAEVGEAYPKTPEGQTAPLWPVDLHALPDGLTLKSRPRFTPTFILMDDGVELTRIEGYPGEDFFWGLLGQMLNEQNIPLGGIQEQG